VSMPTPANLACISVVSAQEMYDAVMRTVAGCDIFLSVAAVGDYRCQSIAEQKIHKQEGGLELKLVRNPDIVSSVGQLADKPFIVGFAAETENEIAQADAKRQRKNMNMIVANRVGKDLAMGTDDNEVTVISATNTVTLPKTAKTKLARELIAMIADQYREKETTS
jgi:phosphopantothenoylcysteine decarboxylase/phosphopantothenate--cysteine ligase